MILLGSGELYIYNMDAPYTLPAKEKDAEIETESNCVGDIKGGARLSYKATEYTVENDKGEAVKRAITKEEVDFKSGLMEWKIDNLINLAPATVTTEATEKVLRIGARKTNNKLITRVVRFVHIMDNGLKLRVTIFGTAANGFELNFDPAKETVIDAVFKAIHATDGTIIEIREETGQKTVAAPEGAKAADPAAPIAADQADAAGLLNTEKTE